VLQTVGGVAAGTVEVNVALAYGACVVMMTYAILLRPGAVFGFVEQMMFGKERQGAEDC